MNEKIARNLGKMVIKTFGAENIKSFIQSFLSGLIEDKSKIPLNQDETDVIGIIYEVDKIACFSVVTVGENINGKTEIIRQITVTSLSNTVDNLIEKI